MKIEATFKQNVEVDEFDVIIAFLELYKRYRGVEGLFDSGEEWRRFPEIEQFNDEDKVIMKVINAMCDERVRNET